MRLLLQSLKGIGNKNLIFFVYPSAELQYTCAHTLLLQMQQPELHNLRINVHLDSLKCCHACSDLQRVCDLQHDVAWNNVGWSLKRLASTAQQFNLQYFMTYHLLSWPYQVSIKKQATELLWWSKPKHAVLRNYCKLSLTATKKRSRNIEPERLMHNSLLAWSCFSCLSQHHTTQRCVSICIQWNYAVWTFALEYFIHLNQSTLASQPVTYGTMLWSSKFYGKPLLEKGVLATFIMLSALQHSVTKATLPSDITLHSDCWIMCLLLQIRHAVGTHFNNVFKFASSCSSPVHGRQPS